MTAIAIIVIKIGGAVCAEPDTITGLVATLEELVANGHRPIVVHGGGPQLDLALLEAVGEPVKHNGLRVTPPAAADTVLRVLDGIGAQLVDDLISNGIPAQHVPGTRGALSATVKATVDGHDLGRVGTVQSFAVPDNIPAGVVVVSPTGRDEHGPLNVNADEAAVAVATAAGADVLVLATDVPGVLNAVGDRLATIDVMTCETLLADGTAKGGMIAKLHNSQTALAGGVGRVWIGPLDPLDILSMVQRQPAGGTLIVAKLEAEPMAPTVVNT